eukprot:14245819-Alexandrium_andersonii.AAC.1
MGASSAMLLRDIRAELLLLLHVLVCSLAQAWLIDERAFLRGWRGVSGNEVRRRPWQQVVGSSWGRRCVLLTASPAV